MRIKIYFFFILVFINPLLAQESDKTILKGKINANTIDLEGVYVINLRTERSTITEKEGYFSIGAIPGDSLLFSAINLKEMKVVLTQKDFEVELLLVRMESNVRQLKEVIVKRYDNINAVALGISPSSIKHLTQAERHLKTATSFDPKATAEADSFMAGGSASLDPILNLFSGRTAMLKKELEVEKKVSFMSQIDNMFNDDYFIKILKIPSEYIKGFKYYVVENERFTSILKSKNKTNIEFVMVELARKYNEIILNEK
ncbi:MAG: hypothetical protein V4572_10115 [Bacteroidota bacterium]